MNNEFKSYIPIELVKGNDIQGNAVMSMKGVASTMSTDSDGEELDPKGFDSSYFLKHGYMNWNHQTNKDPSAIVGRPTTAGTVKDNYQIAFNLFGDSEKAQQVYQLQKVLEKEGLALGLSIEGKVLERDPSDQKKITKARITGCAITPNPKNQDTVTQIIKGESLTALTDIDPDEDEKEKEEKSLTAASSSGQAIAKESLEGDPKLVDLPKKLKKSVVIEKIARDLPSLNEQQIESVFDITIKIQKSIDMKDNKTLPQVTEETIEKAYEILGLATKEIPAKEIEKSKEADEDIIKAIDELSPEELVQRKEDLQKSIKEIDALEKSEEVVKVTEVDYQAMDEIQKGIYDGVHKDEYLEKAVVDEDLNKAEDNKDEDTLIKALTEVIQEEVAGVNNKTTEKFKAVGELFKGFVEKQEEFATKLESIGGSSQGRKSITTQRQHVIEKSFTNDEEEGLKDGEKLVSVSGNKASIAKALTDIWEADGRTDNVLQKSILKLDTTGVANRTIVEKAKEIGLILVP